MADNYRTRGGPKREGKAPVYKATVKTFKALKNQPVARLLLLSLGLVLLIFLIGCRSNPNENPPRSCFPTITVYKNNVYLVWKHAEKLDFQIYFKRSENKGINWEKEIKLSQGRGNCSYPDIEIEGDTLYAVWQQSNENGEDTIMFAESDNNGKTWSKPRSITDPKELSEEPKIVPSGKRIYLAYEGEREDWCDICFKRSLDRGKDWSEEINLSNYRDVSNEPDLAVEGSQIYLIWHDKRDERYEIYFKKSSDGGKTWSDSKRITFTEAASYYPSLAVDQGVVHIVWHDKRHGDAEIYYKRSKDGGETWENDVRLTKAKYNSFNPDIIAEDKKVFVSWEDLRSGRFQIYFKKSSDSGDSWSKDKRLNHTKYGAGYTEMAKWKNNLYLVWTDTRTGADQIFFRSSYDLGKKWNKEMRITK